MLNAGNTDWLKKRQVEHACKQKALTDPAFGNEFYARSFITDIVIPALDAKAVLAEATTNEVAQRFSIKANSIEYLNSAIHKTVLLPTRYNVEVANKALEIAAEYGISAWEHTEMGVSDIYFTAPLTEYGNEKKSWLDDIKRGRKIKRSSPAKVVANPEQRSIEFITEFLIPRLTQMGKDAPLKQRDVALMFDNSAVWMFYDVRDAEHPTSMGGTYSFQEVLRATEIAFDYGITFTQKSLVNHCIDAVEFNIFLD